MHAIVYYVMKIGDRSKIKIGCSQRISHRMKEIAKGSDLIILATEPGGYEHELNLHRRFKNMRVKGSEWFVYGAPLIHHVMELDQVHMRLSSTDTSGYRHPGTNLYSHVMTY